MPVEIHRVHFHQGPGGGNVRGKMYERYVPSPIFSFARFILHLEHRTLLHPALLAIIQPRHCEVGMPQPRVCSIQHGGQRRATRMLHAFGRLTHPAAPSFPGSPSLLQAATPTGAHCA